MRISNIKPYQNYVKNNIGRENFKPLNFQIQNKVNCDTVSFCGTKIEVPIEIFKEHLGGEQNYKKIEKHVTDKRGKYVDYLGARFLTSLNVTKAILAKPYIDEYRYMKQLESEGLPIVGSYKLQYSPELEEIVKEGTSKISSGEISVRDFLNSIDDKDIRADLAENTSAQLKKIIDKIYNEEALDITSGVYDISRNKKTGKTDLSDFRDKIIFVREAKDFFGSNYQDIIDSSYLSNGNFSMLFAEIYILNEVPYKEYMSISAFEKHCLDKNGRAKKEETQFFIDTMHWLDEETADEVFDSVTDKETGRIDIEKAQRYVNIQKICYEELEQEFRERRNEGLEVIPIDCNEIAKLIAQDIK